MGSYVSVVRCQSDYGVNVTCLSNFNTTNGTLYAGKYEIGNVPPNPDVAGVGIISAFIAVTSFALALSAIDVLWRMWKLHQNLPSTSTERKLSLTEICEALVLSCSDQQVFTGGAFAISLRYYNGCSVTAYHYNVIANMLLLTCATHLMSISIVRNYWHNLWQSTLRVILIFGLVLVTGLVLSNQDADTGIKFPTDIPSLNDTMNGSLFLLAAWYQDDSHMAKTLHETFDNSTQLGNSLLRDSPNNHIRGWGFYLSMLVWYLLALLVTYVRRFYHIFRKYGPWVAVGRAFIPVCSSSWVPEEEDDTNDRRHKFFKWLYTIYMLCGVALGSATAITSARYIMDLRSWAQKSGWLETDKTKLQVSPEDDATSFGQQVPILLTLLTVFTAAQTVNRKSDPFLKRNSIFYTDTFTELWDKRGGSQLLHASKPPDTMTSPNGSQDKPPVGSDPETAASNGAGLVHQYLWNTESHPMLSPQPAAGQAYMDCPNKTSSTATANTVPPSNAFGLQQQALGSIASGESVAELFCPVSPVDSGGGPQSPLRHTPSTLKSMRSPSNQAFLQSPELYTEAPSESTCFLHNSTPRSNSNFSRTAAP